MMVNFEKEKENENKREEEKKFINFLKYEM